MVHVLTCIHGTCWIRFRQDLLFNVISKIDSLISVPLSPPDVKLPKREKEILTACDGDSQILK